MYFKDSFQLDLVSLRPVMIAHPGIRIPYKLQTLKNLVFARKPLRESMLRVLMSLRSEHNLLTRAFECLLTRTMEGS